APADLARCRAGDRAAARPRAPLSFRSRSTRSGLGLDRAVSGLLDGTRRPPRKTAGHYRPMTPDDKTPPSQAESISMEFELLHSPEKVWRALTAPELLSEWLLPVLDLPLAAGAAFTFQAPPQPGWDGTVHCRLLEIEAPRKI